MSRAMKDSGIPWIGEIPSHWETDNIGSLYSQRNEKVSDKDYPPLSVSKMGVVPQLETAAKTDDGDNRKLVRKGDFAINSRSDRRGSCGISAYDGSVSLINTILTPRTEMNPRFYDWLFHTSVFADEFYKWGHGIVDDLWTTRWAEMKRISIVVPPIAEQQAIADFLDKKCGEIDEMVSLQEKIVEELKAYKQSVITEAVCKGLNPDVPMRDSGIEWIGQIPEGWQLPNLIWLTSKIGSGYTPKGGSETYVKEGIKFLRSQNVYFEGFNLEDVAYITPEIDEEMAGTRVKEGDILFNITGGSIGRCRFVDSSLGAANVNQHVCIVRPNGISTKYLFYFLQSVSGQVQVDLYQTGGNREGLSASAFKSFVVPLPPKHTQSDIADYLDTKCGEIDTLISVRQAKIDALKEYKKSIIYEYITGKKELNG